MELKTTTNLILTEGERNAVKTVAEIVSTIWVKTGYDDIVWVEGLNFSTEEMRTVTCFLKRWAEKDDVKITHPN